MTSNCTQCGEQRSIVSYREICRDCVKRDGRLDRAQHDLYEAVRAVQLSGNACVNASWGPVLSALDRLEEFYG